MISLRKWKNLKGLSQRANKNNNHHRRKIKMKCKFKELYKLLKKYDDFIITVHVSPDGDGIGSELAMSRLLESMGKRFVVVNEDPVPDCLSFLEGKENILTPDRFFTVNFNPEVALVMDCGELDRVGGRVKEIVVHTNFIINIDHHFKNTNFGDFNCVDDEASSIGEILFEFFSYLRFPIDRQIAEYLYVSIATDTGSFKFENVSPRVHEIVAELLRKGINPSEYTPFLWQSKSLGYLRFLGHILMNMKVGVGGKVAWAFVLKRDLDRYGVSERELEGLIEEIGALKTAEVYFLVKEKGNGTIGVSLRSKRDVDVSRIAAIFGGGGHKKAAGCSFPAELGVEEVSQKILKVVASMIKGGQIKIHSY